jgi:hypothetical protein
VRIKFSQAVHIDGKDYKQGVHELSEKTLAHPHFQKFVQAGWAHEASKEVLPESALDRSKRLADKLSGKSPIVPPMQSQGAEDPSSEMSTDSAPVNVSLEGDALLSVDEEVHTESEDEEISDSADDSPPEQKKKHKNKSKR